MILLHLPDELIRHWMWCTCSRISIVRELFSKVSFVWLEDREGGMTGKNCCQTYMYPPIVLLHVWADELHYYCVTSLTILRTSKTSSVILFYLTECSVKLEPKYFIVLWCVFIWCGEDAQWLNRVCPRHVVYTYSTLRKIIYL